MLIFTTFFGLICISSIFGHQFVAMKEKFKFAQILVFALLTLTFSGRYVAYVSSCEGMGTSAISFSKSTCCCSEDSSVGFADVATFSDSGCCKIEAKSIGVDSFSSNPYKVFFNEAASAPIYAVLASCVLPSNGLSDEYLVQKGAPPDLGSTSGAEIIHTVSRRIRI